MVRYEPDGTGIVVGAWSTGGVRAVPVGTHVALDGPTVGRADPAQRRPERVDSYEGMRRHDGRAAARASASARPSARRSSSPAGCGAR